MKKISRNIIGPVTEIESQGKKYSLGDFRNINQHAALKLGFTFSWVGLDSTQILDPHWHTIDSFIFVYEGHGRSSGTSVLNIQAGDWIYIPAGCFHGFLPLQAGFKAIAFQPSPDNFFEMDQQTHFSSDAASLEKPLRVADDFSKLLEAPSSPRLKLTQKRLSAGSTERIASPKKSLVFMINGELKVGNDILKNDEAIFMENEELTIKAQKPSEFLIFQDIQ